jgi:hypothetical protein
VAQLQTEEVLQEEVDGHMKIKIKSINDYEELFPSSTYSSVETTLHAPPQLPDIRKSQKQKVCHYYCCRSLLAEIRDTEAISRKEHFIVPAQTQWTHVQRLSPKNKGVSPYIPLQTGYRRKKQALIHIRLYFILLATLS